MPERKSQQTRLRITGCAATYHGTHPNGHGYTIYDIDADRVDGTPVQESLKSFEELPVGEMLDLNVQKYESDEWGVSYTLSRRGGSGNAQKIKQLEERMRRVEQALGLENDAASQDAG